MEQRPTQFCPKCGGAIPPGSAFCERCGTPFAPQQSYAQPQQTYAQPQQSYAQPQPYAQPPQGYPGAAAPKKKKTGLIIGLIAGLLVVLGVAGFFLYTRVLQPSARYNEAKSLLEQGKYEQARSVFLELGDYQDSAELARDALYHQADSLLSAGSFDAAKSLYRELGDYLDSVSMAKECDYRSAEALLAAGEFDSAYRVFLDLGGYRDSASRLSEVRYKKGLWLMDEARYDEAIEIFDALGDYEDSAQMRSEVKYRVAGSYESAGNYLSAFEAFGALGDYKNSADRQNAVLEEWLEEAFDDYEAYGLPDELYYGEYTAEQQAYFSSVILDKVRLLEDCSAEEWYDDPLAWKLYDLCDMVVDDRESIETVARLINSILGPDDLALLYENNLDNMDELWDTKMLNNLMRSDRVICGFLKGEWYTSDEEYYLMVNDELRCRYNLPVPTQPDNTAYYYIEDYVWSWRDEDMNLLTEVYRITLVDQNTISVYCYSDGNTYRLTRS